MEHSISGNAVTIERLPNEVYRAAGRWQEVSRFEFEEVEAKMKMGSLDSVDLENKLLEEIGKLRESQVELLLDYLCKSPALYAASEYVHGELLKQVDELRCKFIDFMDPGGA